ncbi:hypothetical protein [Bifidobacterium aquikefiri]|uniref:hypothetical protein n=1 Tax=Bifidobacterium aquikefiri TaxID=1653207 RepID=UPI0023F10BDF|nr:hypothetical protein [Bifidobacterium aquikefiri]
MAGTDEISQGSKNTRESASTGKAEELPKHNWENLIDLKRTPLFAAEHSQRYERQKIITEYQNCTGANLIVVIDQIYPTNMTILEELIGDCDPLKDLHVILSSPGGDGETALRMVRLMHSHSKELTIVVPDMAKVLPRYSASARIIF